jgi:hypothetical protein
MNVVAGLDPAVTLQRHLMRGSSPRMTASYNYTGKQ